MQNKFVSALAIFLVFLNSVNSLAQTTKLERPREIVKSVNVRNPDAAIDVLIGKAKGDPAKVATLELIKGLPHDAKVRWLVEHPAASVDKIGAAVIAVCVMVVVVTTVIVVVGYKLVNGALTAITEEREQEEEKEKCD
jgi:hypothetical protein